MSHRGHHITGVMWGGNQTLDQRFQPSELILGVRGSILEWDTLVFLLCARAVRWGLQFSRFGGLEGVKRSKTPVQRLHKGGDKSRCSRERSADRSVTSTQQNNRRPSAAHPTSPRCAEPPAARQRAPRPCVAPRRRARPACAPSPPDASALKVRGRASPEPACRRVAPNE